MSLTKSFDGELCPTKKYSRVKKQHQEENPFKIKSKYLKEKKMFVK